MTLNFDVKVKQTYCMENYIFYLESYCLRKTAVFSYLQFFHEMNSSGVMKCLFIMIVTTKIFSTQNTERVEVSIHKRT